MLDTHIPLFPGCLFEMTTDRKSILYWCKFYNQEVFSLNESDRPDEFTIDYDILMDDWLEQKRFKEGVQTRGVQRKSAMDMEHVITFDN